MPECAFSFAKSAVIALLGETAGGDGWRKRLAETAGDCVRLSSVMHTHRAVGRYTPSYDLRKDC